MKDIDLQLQRAGWTVRDWCAATSLSRAKFYLLPPAMTPRHVHVGRRRIVTESPAAWLARISSGDAT